TCDVADKCPTTFEAEQADSDGDGVGDVCDPCTNMAPVVIGRALLKIRTGLTPPGDDRLDFKGELLVAASPAIDPMSKGLRVLVHDAAGTTMLDATLS